MSLTSAANDTKWEELRLAMYELSNSPRFSCEDLLGYRSPPEREWFYHFRDGGYRTMRFVDIITDSEEQRVKVLSELKRIGLAGHPIDAGFRVYGYAESGQALSYF